MSVVTEVTAFELLRVAFLTKGNLNPPFEKVPLEILQLDWEKAKTIQLKNRSLSSGKTWELILQIGMRKESVLPLVDPAIIPIIDRVLDLPIMPTASCSAHPWSPLAWITLIFREPGFGKRFIEACKRAAEKNSLDIKLAPYIGRIVGSFGPRMTIGECLKHHLPMTISLETSDDQECLEFWWAFSEILNTFDGKGLPQINPHDLYERVSDDWRLEELRAIWNTLWMGEVL